MKRITYFFAIGLLLGMLAVAQGCKTEPKESEAPIPAASIKIAMIKHPVKDYQTWKAVYLAADSLRNAYGVSKFMLARGSEDTSMVFVADRLSDVAKAKEFASSPALKAAMDQAGVTGPPTIELAEIIRLDTTTDHLPNRMIVSHRVKDFDAWVKVYDNEGRSVRAANGLLDRALARGLDDPNMVYIAFAVTDRAKAEARGQSEELKKLMTDAGVEGAPTFFTYTVDSSK